MNKKLGPFGHDVRIHIFLSNTIFSYSVYYFFLTQVLFYMKQSSTIDNVMNSTAVRFDFICLYELLRSESLSLKVWKKSVRSSVRPFVCPVELFLEKIDFGSFDLPTTIYYNFYGVSIYLQQFTTSLIKLLSQIVTKSTLKLAKRDD
jgi:hypothetical protein